IKLVFKYIMNEHLLKPFWHVVSNRHIEEGMDKLRIVSLRLMNQYVFLMSIIFIIDGIRNLSIGRPINFAVLSAFGCFLFLLSWFTKLHLNVKMATCALIMVTLAVFYRSEEHTSELQSRENLVCRLL